MAVIFQNVKVKKKDFYNWFIQTWVDNGWSDISSSTTDGQMMYSKGENNDRELLVNFKERDSEGVFSTSASRMIDVRFPKRYTPSLTPNTVGILERPSATWWRISLISTTAIGLDATMSVWYYINKNYGAFIIEGHSGYNNGSHFFFVGKPDIEIKGETPESSVMFMSTNSYPTSNNVAYIVDDPYSVRTADYSINIYNSLTPKLKHTLEQKFCSDIVIGDTTGFRYQIDDGILIAQTNDIPTGNIYMINEMKYKFFKTNVQHSTWGNSFYGYSVGIRIE